KCFFFSSRRRHTRFSRDWSSDVCSSDLPDDRQSRSTRVLQQASGAHSLPFAPEWASLTPAKPRKVFPRTAASRLDGSARNAKGRSEERRVGKGWRTRWRQER